MASYLLSSVIPKSAAVAKCLQQLIGPTNVKKSKKPKEKPPAHGQVKSDMVRGASSSI